MTDAHAVERSSRPPEPSFGYKLVSQPNIGAFGVAWFEVSAGNEVLFKTPKRNDDQTERLELDRQLVERTVAALRAVNKIPTKALEDGVVEEMEKLLGDSEGWFTRYIPSPTGDALRTKIKRLRAKLKERG